MYNYYTMSVQSRDPTIITSAYDIEAQTNTPYLAARETTESIERLRDILLETQNENKQTHSFSQKICVLCTVLLLLAPFVICDMYYTYTDNECVSQHVLNLNITMAGILLTSAYGTICSYLFICIVFLSSTNTIDELVIITFTKCFAIPSAIFANVWFILAAVISANMDPHLCNSNTNTYLLVSIILRIILNFIQLIQVSFKKD